MKRSLQGKFTNERKSKIIKYIQIFLALLFLVLMNAFMFYGHYAGRFVFPWDFLGGYHAEAVSWYADGWFFDPPLWISWGNVGFPAYWALQSGAFYLPLQFLDTLDIPYSIVNAVRLQSLHVLLGSLGALTLIRALGLSLGLALLGAIGYHFSVGFYGSQQHVDIIRAAALFPWLMWSFLPNVIVRSSKRPIIATLILFQFMVASYPGNIVSAAYTIMIALGCVATVTYTHALGIERRDPYRNVPLARFLIIAGSAALAGILMSLIKWLPPLSEGDLLAQSITAESPPLSLITTLVLYYDLPFLPLDLTVRSLWLPLPVLLGVFYNRTWSLPAVVGSAMVALSCLSIFLNSNFSSFGLPGYGLSRFPIPDWRPTLHLGLILASCAGWSERLHNGGNWARRDTILMFSLVVLVSIGIHQGSQQSSGAIVLFLGITCILIGYLAFQFGTATSLAALCILTAVQGAMYHWKEGRPWMVPWEPAAEEYILGPNYLGSIAMVDRDPFLLGRRPARFAVGETYEDILSNALSSSYNACFYHGLFCLLGYNNLKKSTPHQVLSKALYDAKQGPGLMAFLLSPQMLIALKQNELVSFDHFPAQQSGDELFTNLSNVTAQVVHYSETSVRYAISTMVPLQIVENEMWTSGWRAKLCPTGNGTCLFTKTKPTAQSLRSWNIPAGSWTVDIFFEVPSMRWAWLAFAVGAVMAGFSSLITYHLSLSEVKRRLH